MSYQFSEKDSVQIISTDNLWNPEENNLIIENVSRLISEGKVNYIVDLSNLPFINSLGLSFLISILTRARSAGGEVLLCGISDKIKQLLLLSRLQTMFLTANTLEEALENFNLSKA